MSVASSFLCSTRLDSRPHRVRCLARRPGRPSLDFAVAGVMGTFHCLKIGLGVVLAFVGVKMLLAHSPYRLDALLSLGVVVGILAELVVASLLRPKTAGPFEGPDGPASLGA